MINYSENYNNFIGIDIGKNILEIAVFGSNKTTSHANTPKGWDEVLKQYEQHFKEALVILETTGGYEKGILYFLLANNICVHRANTRKVKSYIKSYGVQGKSDAIDSKMLAKYGKERFAELPLYAAPNEEEDRLRILVARRQDLVRIRVQEKNRYQAPDNLEVRDNISEIILSLDKGIEDINGKIEELVNRSDAIKQKVEILKTVPGIGNTTAIMFLANMPELGKLSNKQVASLGGVAPHPNDSGSYSGYRKTRGGRKQVKTTLFICAMAARNSKSELAGFYQRLTQNGKKKIVALTALMRKIIVIANARMKENFYQKQDLLLDLKHS